MKTQQKVAVPFEVKAIDATERTFRGLASTWTLDITDDVIHQGAFARTLGIWRGSKATKPIFLLDQHNYDSINRVLGKLVEAQETETGLECTFEVIEGEDGDSALRRIKGGYITALSIGYRAVKWDTVVPEGAQEWESIRHLHEVQLFEISLVIWPAQEEALIDPASVKALLDSFKGEQLTDEQRAELAQLRDDIGALLTDPADAEPKGLAPDDPRRIAVEEMLRSITLRRLGTGV